ncbi:MAG: phospho-N-acetylmuramoyl-pentapeptide-transferase [Bacteroidales bacterium]|jgi:phospho-N-acetylmuramoyl-pentapeptide-transferase|nr:phospho-N-acetylmuramoyl-pentapeptide-transferase [Bacteroidales bacterium]NCU34895.1 phospho-N-acetylmuramoyl-pentapeptide-transferase [Candidatus Falkowbacteria bacterium]MDD3525887.1 phospho-N-acetylmuramoyl-pentapeptide-transferase [Bacteroidales bacterium]MDD4176887.1 phospho-N-acetylmuramoyl-pentapeptide-transferase [Bacteroidales bacterium]MDD4740956.1 phospho-N-acetylmuramoyl-pentapeptide-transferase [Bacteroidales bacterium]
MLYYFFKYLDQAIDFPGAGIFEYISFRAGAAVITSLVISLLFGKRLINFLKKKQVGETIRDLGLDGQMEKQGTPTMGGLIILGAILVPTLLFAKLDNIYIIMILITTVWLGMFGFMDDYIKIFKKDKAGLSGRFKILGQVMLGIFIGSMMYFNSDIVIREKVLETSFIESMPEEFDQINATPMLFSREETKSTKTTIPFVKNNEFDYSIFLTWLGEGFGKWTFLIFIPAVILIITAVSNGANLTDGMDGLATGTSAIIGATLAVFAYVSGNIFFANYLNIMYIPDTGELVVFISAFVGACIGFLWYNSYPAQVFMGDTGSLALGGIIAVFAIMLRKELLIPVLCGIFMVESLSVVMQVGWFKFTKRKYGAGRRIFRMSPLHHHYQVLGYAEPKIVLRFFIIGIMLAVFTIITLKIR